MPGSELSTMKQWSYGNRGSEASEDDGHDEDVEDTYDKVKTLQDLTCLQSMLALPFCNLILFRFPHSDSTSTFSLSSPSSRLPGNSLCSILAFGRHLAIYFGATVNHERWALSVTIKNIPEV